MRDFATSPGIDETLELAESLIPQARQNTSHKQFPHHKAVLLFMEPSTRTMFSTDQAVMNLGMRKTVIPGVDATSVLKGESFADTFRMYVGQGARVLALRSKVEGSPLFAARVCQEYIEKISQLNPGPVNIINCGDGRQWHPTQTILDLLTIKRKLGRIDNFRLGILGDPRMGRTSHTLLQAVAKREGISVVIVAPKGFEMPDRYKAGITNIVESTDMSALADCDIVYVTRFQMERMTDDERRFIESVRHEYTIDKAVLDSWNVDVGVLHPLPRLDEIKSEISLDPRIFAFQQAEYGIPARMALLILLCDGLFTPYTLPDEPETLIAKETEHEINEQKKVRHFQPIDRGTVIDHVPAGRIHVLYRALSDMGFLEKESPRQFVQFVKSSRYPGRKKDVILLDGYHLPHEAAAIIQSMYPKATINFLDGGKTLKKVRYNSPVRVHVVHRCTNAMCITNHDREALRSYVLADNTKSERLVICEYCGTPVWQ